MTTSLGAVRDNWNATRSSTNMSLDQKMMLVLTWHDFGQHKHQIRGINAYILVESRIG